MLIKSLVSVFGLVLFASSSYAQVTTIDFDHDQDGKPITSTGTFNNTVSLTNQYSKLGVTFVGPSQLDGGAILDQSGAFGVNAHSGKAFLAFNITTTLSNGGVPRLPLTLQFDAPTFDISIWVAGAKNDTTFTMTAYDFQGNVVDKATVTSMQFAQLKVAAQTGAMKVTLDQTGGTYFVMDDLEFTQAPVY